jgi:glucose/arabinose dehydrogenase/putative cell wall-binding protein
MPHLAASIVLRRALASGAAAALVLAALGASSLGYPAAVEAVVAPPGKPILSLVKVPGSGTYDEPLLVTTDGTSGRLFVVERTGAIRVIDGGVKQGTPFLSMGAVSGAAFNDSGDEEGLLGLVFDPAFATNHTFYVSYTRTDGSLQVSSFTTATATADTAGTTATPIIDIPHPVNQNHNGGMLNFGPDGDLYIGTGDGGGADDPGAGCGNAQNTNVLLGKLLRIDVHSSSPLPGKAYGIPVGNPFASGSGGAKEVFSWGLRNPWRWSFDRSTGDLWVADVGQDTYEEVDHLGGASPGQGVNFGWPYYEGFHIAKFHSCPAPSSPGSTPPLLVYDHSKGCAIIGGYVYRGSEFPDLVGRYLFGDLCSGTIWDVAAGATSPATPEVLLQSGLTLTGFGEDAAGELYLEEINGGVYHIVSNTTRVSGADRYATSAAVAGLGGYTTGGTVYIASGAGFADALSAAPLAGRDHAPLLLVPPTLPVPSAIASRLSALAPSHLTLIGGTGAIPTAVANHLVATYLGGDAGKLTRLAGADRYDTSAAIADPLRGGKYLPGVGGVIIANGGAFPDGMSGAPVAGRKGWPLMLVRADSIPAPVATALTHLNPGAVWIVGGTGAVSAAVETQLINEGYAVTRIPGADRYATSANTAADFGPDTVPPAVVYVASGTGFADGLSGTPIVAGAGTVLLLLPATGPVPASIRTVICELAPVSFVVLGGPAVVSDATAGGLGQPCP